MNVIRNGVLNNLYLNDKLPILHCSPSGTLRVDQTHKLYDLLDLTQFFQIWPDSVLIEMNDVNNDRLPKVHRFISRSL